MTRLQPGLILSSCLVSSNLCYPINHLLNYTANLDDAYKWYPRRLPTPSRFEGNAVGLASSVKIAKAWFETCHDKAWGHVSCRPLGTSLQTLPTRSIDVGTHSEPLVRVVDTKGLQGRYLTLSYCWGKNPQKVILLKHVKISFELGLRVGTLSKTIQDAIIFTRELGFQYIWIDALCIIQDDVEDKNRELAVMGDIYKRSALTIAAAAGDHADKGLFVHRDPLSRRPCPIYEEGGPKHSNTLYAQLPTEDIVETPLDSRGWVAQEDILATRTLKFCSDGLRWSCASYWMSESTPGLQIHPASRPHTTFREWIHQPDWKPNHHEALDMDRHCYEDWYELVASYTDRSLTNVSDKLPAVAGLAQWMRKIKGCTYIQGLWKEDLEYGLLWYLGTPLEASPLSDLLRGNKYYRTVTVLDPRVLKALQLSDATHVEKKTTFLSPDSLSYLEVQKYGLRPSQATFQPNDSKISNWSWASLQTGSIRFLYGRSGLSALGAPMAKCLTQYGTKAHSPGGLLVLQGALKQVTITLGKVSSEETDYQPTSMTLGRWVVSLHCTVLGTKRHVGYAALDQDPAKSSILNSTLSVLLMRDDMQGPSPTQTTASGYRRLPSMVPMTLSLNANGFLVNNGTRRYTTALLLKKQTEINPERSMSRMRKLGSRSSDFVSLYADSYSRGLKGLSRTSATAPVLLERYKRVGLCQTYHFVWAEELKDSKKREEILVLS